jgi:serine/threonine protein kinase
MPTVCTMPNFEQPNIVKFVESFEFKDHMYIVMEYLPGGDLSHLAREGPLEEERTKQIARQILTGLDYMHRSGVTHRDIKPENIMIQSIDPINVKLTDFGLSKVVSAEETILKTFCGTLLYLAPEVFPEYSEYIMLGEPGAGSKRRRPPPQVPGRRA